MNLGIWKRIIRTDYGLSLGMCILLQGAFMAVMLPTLPVVLAERIGLDKSAVTLFFFMNTILGIIVSLVSGYLSDGAIARYKLVILGGVISALGFAGIATATIPVHAFLAGAAMVGLGILFPQLFAVAKAGIVAGWQPEDQVMGITALRTLFSFGFILGTALASWLVGLMDIQALFMPLAVAVLFLTMYSGFVLYQLEAFIAARPTGTSPGSSGAVSANQPITLPLYALVVPLLALTIMRGADSTRGVYLALAMFQLYGDATIAPLMFGLTAAVELITLGLVSYLASKIGDKAAISISSLFGAVSFFLLSFSQSLPLLYFSQVLYAVFVAGLLGVAMAYVQSMMAHRVGLGGSVYIAVFNFGSLIGLFSPLVVANYDQAIFIIPMILCVVGAAMLMFGDRSAQIEKRLRELAAQRAVVSDPVIASVPPVALETEG
jgi:SET family sugar efflux transporter-like MFS transporter